jgi:hypothetical protein
MIERVLSLYQLSEMFNDILKMTIFDFLIGNTDRHHSNWALIQNNNKFNFCPLYDNGSSLCCYIHQEDLYNFLGNDHQRFMALVDGKSKSRIRVNGKIKKEPRHTEVLKYIYENHNDKVIKFIRNLIYVLTEDKINCLITSFGIDVIGDDRKKLIYKYLVEKRKILIYIFKI